MTFRFKEAKLKSMEWGSQFGFMLSFVDDKTEKVVRHAVRIPVGEDAERTLKGLHGFLDYCEKLLKRG